MQVCANLNHHEKMKAVLIRLFPHKLIANLELLIVILGKNDSHVEYILHHIASFIPGVYNLFAIAGRITFVYMKYGCQ